MELTEKCKEDFDKWFKLNYEAIGLSSIDDYFYLEGFYELPESMQYGVYVEFFDSVKYEGKSFLSKIFARYYKDKTEYFSYNDIIRNSIESANEIYNKIK